MPAESRGVEFMHKEGINLNTVTIEKLKTLPGIGDNLARSIILHRELKSEFVNPDEFKSIVPEKVYSDIAKNYNIYAVSPFAWKSRIVQDEFKLYNRDLGVYFIGAPPAVVIHFLDKLYVLGFTLSPNLRYTIYGILGEGGLFLTLKKFFGWKASLEALVLAETPDMNELESFLSEYSVGRILIPDSGLIMTSGSAYKNISDMLMTEKVKAFAPSVKITGESFEICPVYPLKSTGVLSAALLARYGEVGILFLFNIAAGDEKNMIETEVSEKLRTVKIICFFGAKPTPLLTKFCGNPLIIKTGDAGTVFCDGNVAYVQKRKTA